MWWEGHFTSGVFLPKNHHPSLNHEKNIKKFTIEGYAIKHQANSDTSDILQSTCLALQTVKIIKNKDSLRLCHSERRSLRPDE